MLYLLRTDDSLDHIYNKLEQAIEILNSICGSTLECYVLLDDDIKMSCGKEVRGRYILLDVSFPCRPNPKSSGVIFLDKTCTFVELCTALVHEWAHHLTQEGDGGKLFLLFKSWLRAEFVRRWNYDKGRKD
jgi:hypothetical protein